MGKLAVLLALLSGCDLYFNHGGGDDICAGAAAPSISSAESLRDPSTGSCQTFSDPYPCDGACGPCNYGAIPPLPDWATCQGACEALDEATCLTTSGCRAAFTDGGGSNPWQAFLGCWETAPSGPIEGGGCVGLDDYACSKHDDCSPIYTTIQSGIGDTSSLFEKCVAEPTSPDQCAAVDCGPGSQCEVQCTVCDPNADSTCTPFCKAMCVPDQLCDANTCGPGYTCVEQCDAMNPGTGAPGTCTTACIPINSPVTCAMVPTETACKTRTDCRPVYVGTNCTCYPGYCECATETYERCETLP